MCFKTFHQINRTNVFSFFLTGLDGQPKQDAKELAKKLVKSGAISMKPPEKEKQGFKRSKNSQRKKLEQLSADKPKYQPFSAAVYKPSLSELDSENSGRSSGMFESGLPSKEKEAIAREETFREKRRDGKTHYVCIFSFKFMDFEIELNFLQSIFFFKLKR